MNIAQCGDIPLFVMKNMTNLSLFHSFFLWIAPSAVTIPLFAMKNMDIVIFSLIFVNCTHSGDNSQFFAAKNMAQYHTAVFNSAFAIIAFLLWCDCHSLWCLPLLWPIGQVMWCNIYNYILLSLIFILLTVLPSNAKNNQCLSSRWTARKHTHCQGVST